jgi:hypothetical protein
MCAAHNFGNIRVELGVLAHAHGEVVLLAAFEELRRIDLRAKS